MKSKLYLNFKQLQKVEYHSIKSLNNYTIIMTNNSEELS